MQAEADVQGFLTKAGWGGAQVAPMPADFSTRRFARVTRDAGAVRNAILMCAAPDQKTDLFVGLSAALRRADIPAPEIYANDIPAGMALMEDFGDQPVGKLIDGGVDRRVFDEMSAQLLARLHKNFDPSFVKGLNLPVFDSALFTQQAGLFLDHFFPHITGRAAMPEESDTFNKAWESVLLPLDTLPRSLLLRDYMPDNAMKLAAPVFGMNMGVIDFQDAGIGPIAYDLGSWCEQLRRVGGLTAMRGHIETYHKQNPVSDVETLLEAVRILSAQRAARFLGIVIRLNRQHLIPCIWNSLQTILQDEAMLSVRQWFDACVGKELAANG